MERYIYLSLTISINALQMAGFWSPRQKTDLQRYAYISYSVFSFMFLLGVYVFIQVVDMFMIWGNLPMMTGTAFLLFTNLAQVTKVVNLLLRKEKIQRIIDEGNEYLVSVNTEEARRIVERSNRETALQQLFYFFLTTVTVGGWAGSAEKNQLPMRAWYPYDTSLSPSYELTYCHQVGALFVAAYLNVAKDTLVTSLVAQCRCRLELINLDLKTLHEDVDSDWISKGSSLFSPEEEAATKKKLDRCIQRHQRTLQAVADLQDCFSAPTFAQFTVSLVIICVTAFQLASQLGNPVRLVSMTTYLLNMSYQVFIYCYQGEQLREGSTKIADAAYECMWYRCTRANRRSILNMMVRSRRPAVLNACGFTSLSLHSFMAIIKASYSFFTVLQQVEAES